MNKGLLTVISGPSGSGKGTVIGNLMQKDDRFVYSVSATTRVPRDGEVDGVNYHFLGKDEFERRIASGSMLEWAEYCGNYYGTPVAEVEKQLEAGKSVILEIEVEGAMQVKKKCPEALLIMIAPPDFETLEARLRGRGDKVAEEVLLSRLATAKIELAKLDAYDYVVINGTDAIEKTASEIIGIVDAERHRVSRNPDFYTKFFGRSL